MRVMLLTSGWSLSTVHNPNPGVKRKRTVDGLMNFCGANSDHGEAVSRTILLVSDCDLLYLYQSPVPFFHLYLSHAAHKWTVSRSISPGVRISDKLRLAILIIHYFRDVTHNVTSATFKLLNAPLYTFVSRLPHSHRISQILTAMPHKQLLSLPHHFYELKLLNIETISVSRPACFCCLCFGSFTINSNSIK